MVLHQPTQQIGFVIGEKMVFGKFCRIGHTQIGMVAATAFGDVVKQSRQIHHGFVREARHQAGGKR